MEKTVYENIDFREHGYIPVPRNAIFRNCVFHGMRLPYERFTSTELYDCDFRNANLLGASFKNTKLVRVNFYGAQLLGATFNNTAAKNIKLPGYIPKVRNLSAKILEATGPGAEGDIDMGWWHTCKTTHCLAGWAVVLAGAAGDRLEGQTDPETAGFLIFAKSEGWTPNFFIKDKNSARRALKRQIRRSQKNP